MSIISSHICGKIKLLTLQPSAAVFLMFLIQPLTATHNKVICGAVQRFIVTSPQRL